MQTMFAVLCFFYFTVNTEDAGAESSSKSLAELTDKDATSNLEAKEQSQPKEMVDFKVVYNKQKYDINFALDDSVSSLKQHLETLTGISIVIIVYWHTL